MIEVLYGSWYCRAEERCKVFLLLFFISLKNFSKQIVVYHSVLTVLWFSKGWLRRVQFNRKKTLVGLGSSSDTQTEDCSLLSGFMYFERSRSNFFNISWHHRTNAIFALRQIMRNSSEISLSRSKIDCIAVCNMLRHLYLSVSHIPIFFNHVTHSLDVLRNDNRFWSAFLTFITMTKF